VESQTPQKCDNTKCSAGLSFTLTMAKCKVDWVIIQSGFQGKWVEFGDKGGRQGAGSRWRGRQTGPKVSTTSPLPLYQLTPKLPPPRVPWKRDL
jgi:hypothetical protein